MSSEKNREIIGKTSATQYEHNLTGKFYFWLSNGDIIINPFDFVVAEQIKDTKTIGIIREISGVTDAQTHLTNVLSEEAQKFETENWIERIHRMVAEVEVLRNTGYRDNDRFVEIKMPLQSNQNVYFADKEEILRGLGIKEIDEGKAIPAGLIIQSNGMIIPTYFDQLYLLGPEGAHLNVSGISGLATKTSYIMFLINAIYQKMKDDIAVIIFNVKQADLLHLDEDPTDLRDIDKKYYELFGLETKPFENVKYFLPRGKGESPDSEQPLPKKYNKYAYELADVYDKLDLLFAGVPDPYYTIETFTSRIKNDWKNGVVKIVNQNICNWADFHTIEPSALAEVYKLYPDTAKRILRNLRRLISDHSIFVNNRSKEEFYVGSELRNIKKGEIYVIDIFRIHSNLQPFIVGDVITTIDELYFSEDRTNLPKKLIIFIDELNTYAPRYIREQLVEISRKGRSRGTILFTAEQFKSDVHDQIIGNCSVHAFGRTGSSELNRDVYGSLDRNVKQKIMTLEKGEMVISFPTWRTPVRIHFPMASYKRPQ